MREEGRGGRKGKGRLKMEEKPLKVKRGEARVHTDVPMKTPSGSSNHELPDPVPAAGQVSGRGPDPVGAAVPHEDWFLKGRPCLGRTGREGGRMQESPDTHTAIPPTLGRARG